MNLFSIDSVAKISCPKGYKKKVISMIMVEYKKNTAFLNVTKDVEYIVGILLWRGAYKWAKWTLILARWID